MGPILDAQLRVWDAKNFGLVSPGTHRNKFVKKSLHFLKTPILSTPAENSNYLAEHSNAVAESSNTPGFKLEDSVLCIFN